MSLYLNALFGRYPTLQGIPGPPPRFPGGNLSDLGAKPAFEMTLDCARNYGPYTLMWVLNQPLVVVHDPAAIDEILNSKREYFIKDEPTGAMRPAATRSSVFLANGPEWARRKRESFFAGPHHGAWLDESFEPIVRYVKPKLDLVTHGAFEERLYRLVFDVMTFLTLDHEFPDEDLARYNHLMDVSDLRMRSSLPILSPQFYWVRKRWFAAIEKVAAKNEKDPMGRSISHLLLRHSAMPREELISELSNVFPGGLYSITAALGHILALVSRDEPTLQALRKELRALGTDARLDYGEVKNASLLDRVIRESLRLFAPVPVFLRRVKAPRVEVGGLTLTEGVRVMIGIAPLQKDPLHWPDAESFKPERWTPEVIAENPYGSNYFFPFGRGPRSCSGGDMALLIIRSVLFAMLGAPEEPIRVSWPKDHRFYFGCMMPRGMTAKRST